MTKSKHLTETHDMTLEEADGILAEIARTTLAIRKVEVAQERRVQAIQDEAAAKTAEDRRSLSELEGRLKAFVEGHRAAFAKPRMRVTAFGSYGLTASTRTVVEVASKVVAWLKRHGHKDAVKTTEKPVGKMLTKLLREGAKVTGASLVTGEIHKYQLDPAILEEL